MALWQFKLEVIPAERLGGRAEIDAAEFEGDEWWRERRPPSDLHERLAELLPPARSWHEELLWFGEENGDRVDVWLESDRVSFVQVRFDCRRPNLTFVERLLHLAREWSCVLVESRYRKVLPADLPGFVEAIEESPNRRFLQDPEKWLPKLAAEARSEDRR